MHRSSPSAASRAPGSTSSARRSTGCDERRAAPADFPTRLYVDRVFTLRGIGTIATGTLWSGTIADGDRAAPRAGRARRAGPLACRCTTRPSSVPRRGSASPSACRGSSARPLPRRRARRSGRLPALVPARGGAGGARADRRRRPALRPSRDAPDPRPRRHASASDHAQLRLAEPVHRRARRPGRAARRDDGRRRDVVLDPAPPAAARRRARSTARARRPGLDRARAGPRARPRRGAGCAGAPRRRRARGGLDAVRVVDGWAFSEAWLDGDGERASSSGSRARAEASPLEPGLSLGELLPEPWAPAVLGAAARRAARCDASCLPGTVGVARSARGPRRRRWRRPSARPGSRRRRSRTPSSRVSSRRRAGSCGSATATRSARAPTRSRATSLVTECAAAGEITLAASATSRASAGAMRSSCSSA